MQTHSKIRMLDRTITIQNEEDSEFSTHELIMDYYYLKYRHDHSFVIRDNKLNRNVEVMIGKRTLYCSFHDTRNPDRGCDHITYVKILSEIGN